MADKKPAFVLLEDLSKPGTKKHPPPRGRPFTIWLLVISWPRLLAMAAVVYVMLVALFACGYLSCGGVTARAGYFPGYFRDAFLFSMQVFARVNLGFRMPERGLSQLLVICELLMGWLVFVVFLALAAARFMNLRVFELYGLPLQEAPDSGDRALANRRSSQKAASRQSN